MDISSNKPKDLRDRTRKFALRIIRLYISLPKSTVAQVIGNQILRSGTSVGAQYAESYRAKTKPDFINKVEGAQQELEETLYWIDLLEDSEILKPSKLKLLREEINELMAILVAMEKRTKAKLQ